MPKEIPPLGADIRDKLNQSLNQSMIDRTMLNAPPALVHAGFEGGISIS
jgi:hypothetical protein